VFNPDEFQFAKDTVEFAGFDIKLDGFKPTERIMKTIQEFPTPRTVTDIRSWFSRPSFVRVLPSSRHGAFQGTSQQENSILLG